jgi:peptidoglycan/xylan/chitin deacetylase (PgdA/CDA1 family)
MRGDPVPRIGGSIGALVVALALASACGGSDDGTGDSGAAGTTTTEAAAAPAFDPTPAVKLTSIDREVWTPGPPDRSQIPVLLYHGIAPKEDFAVPADAVFGVDPAEFAKQMVLLDTAGYETVTLDEFRRFVAGEDVELPPHPLLLTFDDARRDSWTGGEGILRELGFDAVLFVDVGRVEDGDPEYLTWPELAGIEENERWQLQLHSGEGHQQIQFGPAATDVGPFYAYKKEGETIDDWRDRAFGDIEWGEETLAEHIPTYEPLAFAPPFGSYGQEGTNDDRIPEELLPWLVDRFGLVFTQDVSIFARPGQEQPVGRLQITRDLSGGQLHEFLTGKRTEQGE